MKALIALLTLFAPAAFCAVVLTDAVSFTTPAEDAKYSLTLFTSSDLSNPTGITFDKTGTTLFFKSEILNSKSDWYIVSNNASFTFSAIDQNQFQKFDIADYSATIANNFVNLGFTAQDADDERTIIGWVRFINYGGTSSRLDYQASATAYGADGIVVGTQNVIPEPSVTCLFFTGFIICVAIGLTRRCS